MSGILLLKLIPVMIGLLSGSPDPARLLSQLIAIAGEEVRSDAADRLVAMHFKDGLVHLRNTEVERNPERKRQHAELARRAFISASNVEVDLIRIGRAQLYISGASSLLGDEELVLDWAEQAYISFSDAEGIIWRGPYLTKKDQIVYSQWDTVNVGQPCSRIITEPIANALKKALDMGAWWPSFGDPASMRWSRLQEVYEYKAPLARLLRSRGSTIRELEYPDTIAKDDHWSGARAGARVPTKGCRPG